MNLLSQLVWILALDVFAPACQQPDILSPDACRQSQQSTGLTWTHDVACAVLEPPRHARCPEGAARTRPEQKVMFIDGDDREKIPEEQAVSEYPFAGAWFMKKSPRAAMQFAGNATAVHPRVVVMTSHQVTPAEGPGKSLFNENGSLKNAADSTWILFAGCDAPVKIETFTEVGWFLGDANSPANDYAVAILSESCLRPEQVARPASLNGVPFSSVYGRPVEMVSRVPSHSLYIPGTDYRTFLGRDVFVFAKSEGKITHRFQDEPGMIRVLIHDLDADHGHSGSGILMTDREGRKRFVGVLSGSAAGRDPVSLAAEYTNSVAFSGALQAAVERAIAEVEGP